MRHKINDRTHMQSKRHFATLEMNFKFPKWISLFSICIRWQAVSVVCDVQFDFKITEANACTMFQMFCVKNIWSIVHADFNGLWIGVLFYFDLFVSFLSVSHPNHSKISWDMHFYSKMHILFLDNYIYSTERVTLKRATMPTVGIAKRRS